MRWKCTPTPQEPTRGVRESRSFRAAGCSCSGARSFPCGRFSRLRSLAAGLFVFISSRRLSAPRHHVNAGEFSQGHRRVPSLSSNKAIASSWIPLVQPRDFLLLRSSLSVCKRERRRTLVSIFAAALSFERLAVA